MRIFMCKECKCIISILREGTCIPRCCGEEMTELKANTVDAAFEKHVPVIDVSKNTVVVTCGEVLHPMEEKHYIEFMILETNKGYQIKYLKPGEEPTCIFTKTDDEKIISAYAYCNLHGLWVSNNE